MHVIPVLDLLDGLVVLASGGRRDTYLPINTPLCSDPLPMRVVESFLQVFPFEFFYVADLDSIEGKRPNSDLIIALAKAHPDIEFWIDAGFTNAQDLDPYATVSNVRFVIGSESQRSIQAYSTLCQDARLGQHILSLDRKDGTELGPAELVDSPDLWPNTVISMDLTRVGLAAGPNVDRIHELQDKRQTVNIVAAGGIRNINDLLTLAAVGVNYALVATALHSEKLDRTDLERLG
jgi:phosphoribosylformimino-5-aminoimidazole carboxamide ribotide isomerase